MTQRRLWLYALFFLSLWTLGLADDCSSPEDAMDTWWVGPPIKAAISVIIAAVVNGETIISTLIKGGSDDDGGEEDDEPPVFTLDVSTQDQQTRLTLDAPEGLWVYAAIRVIRPPPNYNPASDLQTVRFSGPPHLVVGSPQTSGTTRAAMVRVVTPADGNIPQEVVLTVSASLNGNPIAVPVTFTVDGGYRLIVTTRSEWTGV